MERKHRRKQIQPATPSATLSASLASKSITTPEEKISRNKKFLMELFPINGFPKSDLLESLFMNRMDKNVVLDFIEEEMELRKMEVSEQVRKCVHDCRQPYNTDLYLYFVIFSCLAVPTVNEFFRVRSSAVKHRVFFDSAFKYGQDFLTQVNPILNKKNTSMLPEKSVN
jgi:hypothetical protein